MTDLLQAKQNKKIRVLKCTISSGLPNIEFYTQQNVNTIQRRKSANLNLGSMEQNKWDCCLLDLAGVKSIIIIVDCSEYVKVGKWSNVSMQSIEWLAMRHHRGNRRDVSLGTMALVDEPRESGSSDGICARAIARPCIVGMAITSTSGVWCKQMKPILVVGDLSF